MATLARQPFAPLDGARLQTLTSLKNRQSAISSPPVKRKASEVLDVDDFENVDPTLFSKRSKGVGNFNLFKPSSFILTKSVPTPNLPPTQAVSPVKPVTTPSRPRTIIQPKSPAPHLNTNIPFSSPRTAPAGRSPTRGSKRIGILSRRRTTRIDPPSFGLGSAAPFSLDAALKGTIPSYGDRTNPTSSSSSNNVFGNLHEPEMKSSWFFDIHEDTPEQEMTNLLQHSTCTLDISSDEESERRASRERAEGRDKENIPPLDDVSQTSSRRRNADEDSMVIEKARGPLLEMNAVDYYAEGCDEASVVIIPGDEEDGDVKGQQENVPEMENSSNAFEFAPKLKIDADVTTDLDHSIDEVMSDKEAAKAAVLQPIEGTGESFELWESSSAKDEAEVPASPAPVVETAEEAPVA